MGRWTPLILMGGGLAILLGTLLGINFPMGGQQQTASNNAPSGKREKVLPANINVNSSAPSTGSRNTQEETASTPQENANTPTEPRTTRRTAQENASTPTEPRTTRRTAQENLTPRTTERRTSVAQNTTPNESPSSSDNSDTTTTTREVQSTDTSVSDNESTKEPIRALW